MCGYLPFTNHMEDILKPDHASDGDPFQSEDKPSDDLNKSAQVRSIQQTSIPNAHTLVSVSVVCCCSEL